MSEDWNVYCAECDSVHGFQDANHQEDLMFALVEHREALAGLEQFFADPRIGQFFELRCFYGSIDASWFKEHAGHRLAIRSEYGEVLYVPRPREDAG